MLFDLFGVLIDMTSSQVHDLKDQNLYTGRSSFKDQIKIWTI